MSAGEDPVEDAVYCLHSWDATPGSRGRSDANNLYSVAMLFESARVIRKSQLSG